MSDICRLLESGDPEAVVQAFRGLDEKTRRAIAPEVIDWCTGGQKGEAGAVAIHQHEAIAVPAVLACATFSELSAWAPRWLNSGYGLPAYAVLADRRPSWVGRWVDFNLKHAYPSWGGPHWPFIRKLVRDGICPRPECDEYILYMIAAPIGITGRRRLADGLRQDAGLLTDEIWKLFEVEGRKGGSLNLSTSDMTYRNHVWAEALVELASDGTIPRERLLDATIDALSRDFSVHNARWYQDFHQRLKPTTDELAARAHRYVSLLQSRVSATVSLALDALEQLDHSGALPVRDVVAGIDHPLYGAPKPIAKRTLDLLDSLIRQEPSIRPLGLHAAMAGLNHPHPDVQTLGAELIERHLRPSDLHLWAELTALMDDISPSIRRRLSNVTGGGDGDTEACWPALEYVDIVRGRIRDISQPLRQASGVEEGLAAVTEQRAVPGLRFRLCDIPVLSPEAAIAPIDDLDELLQVLTALLEQADDPDDIERAIDGVSRMCGTRPPGFDRITGPLRKRAIKVLDPGESWSRGVPLRDGYPRVDIAALVLMWLGELHSSARHELLSPYQAAGWGDPNSLLSARVADVARRAELGAPRQQLAAPTHRGGWIDARTLTDRLMAESGSAIWVVDGYQALLRLAPDHEQATLNHLKGMGGEMAAAIRHALGDPDAGLPERTMSFWPAAEAVRIHHSKACIESNVLGLSYPVQGVVPTPTAPGEAQNVLWKKTTVGPYPWRAPTGSVRWQATICPAAREDFFRLGADSLDAWMQEAPMAAACAYLEPMLDPDVALGPWALRLLFVGLNAAGADVRGVATDVLVQCISDGRLDAEAAGGELDILTTRGALDLRRLSLSLGDAARASSPHAELVRLVVERSLKHALLRQHADQRGQLPLSDLLAGREWDRAAFLRKVQWPVEQAPAAYTEALIEATRRRTDPTTNLKPSADLHALLGLLHELAIDARSGVAGPEARALLTDLGGSSKAGRLARQLVAMPVATSRHVATAATAALEARLARAERWARTAR